MVVERTNYELRRLKRSNDCLTPKDAALILNCNRRRINHLCDKGLLHFYRVPMSTHRRIFRFSIRDLILDTVTDDKTKLERLAMLETFKPAGT